jgi:hypothetical protein
MPISLQRRHAGHKDQHHTLVGRGEFLLVYLEVLWWQFNFNNISDARLPCYVQLQFECYLAMLLQQRPSNVAPRVK